MATPDKEYAAKSVAVAQRSLNEEITVEDAADEVGIGRSGPTLARIVLRFGTAADLANVLEGKLSLRTVHDEVKKRMTPEQMADLKVRNNKWTTKRRALEGSESQVWSELSDILKRLGGLPQPEDVINIVRRNNVRKMYVNQQIYAAAKWMEEFLEHWSRPD